MSNFVYSPVVSGNLPKDTANQFVVKYDGTLADLVSSSNLTKNFQSGDILQISANDVKGIYLFNGLTVEQFYTGNVISPRIESKDIILIYDQTRKIKVKSDIIQSDFKFHNLPNGYTQRTPVFPEYIYLSSFDDNHTTEIDVTAPSFDSDFQEVNFGSVNGKNWKGVLRFKTVQTSPDFVINYNSLSVGRYKPGLVEINNKIYVIGGSGTNTMEVIDTSVTPYTVTTSPVTLPFTSFCSAINVGNKVYIFTGTQVYKTDDITIFNPVFSLISGVNTVSMSVPALVLVGTNIYVFGGPTGAIYVFDTTADTISTHSATLSCGFFPSASYNSTSNKIYVFGNDTLVRVLDLTANTSSTLTAQSDGIIQGTSAINNGNDILVTGGSGMNTMQSVRTTQIFDTATETFSSAGSPLLDESLNFVAAIKLNNKVVVVGGLKSNGLTDEIQYFEI